MSSMVKHCPFLNRADVRCSESFCLDKLDSAFRYCFGRYKSCTVYTDLLIERRVRQSDAISTDENHDRQRIIQVSIRRKIADGNAPADAKSLPALSGVGARAR